MPKRASSTRFFYTNFINTPFEKSMKFSICILEEEASVTSDKALEFGEELFNRVQVRRVG